MPAWLTASCDRLRSHSQSPWDADDFMEDEYVWASPIGELVSAFVKNGVQTAETQLIWLMMFAARRALPCWQIYCDTTQPIDTVNAIHDWLVTRQPRDWSRFTTPAQSSHGGIPIIDCRACDTGASAGAAAEAAQFIEERKLIYVVYSLSSADVALDQSPLQSGNHYRQWFMDVAIPGAYLQRNLTDEEQSAFLDYDLDDVLRDTQWHD